MDAWSHSFWWTLAAVLVWVLWHAALFACQFVIVAIVNRRDPAPRAGVAALLGAWVGELIMAIRVFLWRQPFRANAVPDNLASSPGINLSGRRGVVLVHGFICNRGFWNPWTRWLKKEGHAFVAVNLKPVFGAIDSYVPLIEAAVAQVTQATGLPPVVICHSMGGVAVRAWLQAQRVAHAPHDAHHAKTVQARVHHVITIASPHHGTWMGRFAVSENGRQMQLNSPWLRHLASTEPADMGQRFTCFYSNCDNIVLPASTATLAGADNRLVTGVAHIAMAFDQTVMNESLALACSKS
jgi:triacylglycerol esterase/lipase EstA (alpha/beta hydrolase family)